jgi:hypothetical protein
VFASLDAEIDAGKRELGRAGIAEVYIPKLERSLKLRQADAHSGRTLRRLFHHSIDLAVGRPRRVDLCQQVHDGAERSDHPARQDRAGDEAAHGQRVVGDRKHAEDHHAGVCQGLGGRGGIDRDRRNEPLAERHAGMAAHRLIPAPAQKGACVGGLDGLEAADRLDQDGLLSERAAEVFGRQPSHDGLCGQRCPDHDGDEAQRDEYDPAADQSDNGQRNHDERHVDQRADRG